MTFTIPGTDIELKTREETEVVIEAFSEEVMSVIEKHFPENIAHEKARALGQVLFLLNGPTTIQDTYLGWVVDRLVESSLADRIKKVENEFAALENLEHFEGNRFVWNDLDNHAWVYRLEDRRVLIITTQNCKFIYIMADTPLGKPEFSIYQYWAHPDDEEWEEKEKEIREGGLQRVLESADWYAQNYSDRHLRNRHMHRPDLEWFKEHGFDRRSVEGYIAGDGLLVNTGDLMGVEHSIGRINLIQHALFDIDSLDEALMEYCDER